MTFKNPPRDEIQRLLERAQTVAVVGLSPKRERDSFMVASALQQFGYKVIPVHPHAERILNEPVVHDLASVTRQLEQGLPRLATDPDRLRSLTA